jgi:C4-dicarboxylate-binding protein DctP
MKQGLTRRGLARSAAATLGTFAILRHARGEAPIRLRCSLDTAPSHVRNVSIADYLEKVEKATGGAVTGEIFASGQLFADLNVDKALLQGQVDMAAPGGWAQTGIVSDCDYVQLPVFYSQTMAVTHAGSDGKPGAIVVGQLEAKLKTKVLGKFIDLGFQNWYTTKKPVHSLDDLKGLKLRSPGGAGISWRIDLVGGIANTTAWPNVPLALSQGTFDGFVSTDESCSSAKLWEAGVKYSYADHQYVGQYIPMLSGAIWARLSAEQQKIMQDVWEANIATYRANALAAQERARKLMESNGVVFVDPTPEQTVAARKFLQSHVDGLIKASKLSPEIVKASDDVAGSVG